MSETDLSPSAFAAFDLLEQPLWVFARDDLRILAANRASRAWFGQDVVPCGTRLTDLCPPEAQEALARAVAGFPEEEKDAGAWPMRRHDGATRRLRLHWRKVAYGETPAILAEVRGEADAADPDDSGYRALFEADRAAALDRSLDLVLENVSDAILVLDRDLRFTFLNGRAEQLLGRGGAELLGRHVWEEFPEAIGGPSHESYRVVMDEGRSVRFEEYYPPLGRWFRVAAYPVRDGVAVFFRDATEERQREEQLRLLETAVAHMGDMLVITEANPVDDPGPRVVYVNDAFERITGYSRDEIIGRTPRILQGEETSRRELDRIRAALEAYEPVRAELTNYTKSGEPFHVEIDIVPLADGAGPPTHFVALQRDVTKRELARAAEWEMHERVRLVSEVVTDFVWEYNVLDDEWARTPRHRDILGLSPDEGALTLEETIRLVHPEDRDRFASTFREALAGTDSSWTCTYRVLSKGGLHYFENNAAIVRDADGNAVRVVGGLCDITRMRLLDDQLREVQKLDAIGQLTGGIAHDFNNILTVILGNAELLGERLEDAPQLRAMADAAVSAAEKGAELTNRLLAFARRQPLEPRSVDLNRLVGELRHIIQRTLPESIDIDCVPGPDLWAAHIDPTQFETALLNLVINARDALGDAAGRIRVETANATVEAGAPQTEADVAPGDYVVVSVSDDGEGMDSETLQRAFEPFFTTKPAGKGSGLGLSMVFGFVKQSKGAVRIESVVGLGTTVKLFFPRHRAAEAPAARAGEADALLGGTDRILVVEDDELVRGNLCAQLRALGYRVTAAADGNEALEIVRGERGIDLLLTDIVMPGGMNGRELAERVLALRPSVRVLFTSGYSEDAIVHHGRLDPGIHLLSKPYRREALARKLREVLDG